MKYSYIHSYLHITCTKLTSFKSPFHIYNVPMAGLVIPVRAHHLLLEYLLQTMSYKRQRDYLRENLWELKDLQQIKMVIIIKSISYKKVMESIHVTS